MYGCSWDAMQNPLNMDNARFKITQFVVLWNFFNNCCTLEPLIFEWIFSCWIYKKSKWVLLESKYLTIKWTPFPKYYWNKEFIPRNWFAIISLNPYLQIYTMKTKYLKCFKCLYCGHIPLCLLPLYYLYCQKLAICHYIFFHYIAKTFHVHSFFIWKIEDIE